MLTFPLNLLEIWSTFFMSLSISLSQKAPPLAFITFLTGQPQFISKLSAKSNIFEIASMKSSSIEPKSWIV